MHPTASAAQWGIRPASSEFRVPRFGLSKRVILWRERIELPNQTSKYSPMKFQATLVLLVAAGFAAESPFGRASARAAEPDYLRDVKPILSEHCYRCHGASQQKGGLRLDTAGLAKKGGDAGPALVAGGSSDSLIVQVIKGTHRDIPRMPYKKPALGAQQIALVESWIAAGARAPEN